MTDKGGLLGNKRGLLGDKAGLSKKGDIPFGCVPFFCIIKMCDLLLVFFSKFWIESRVIACFKHDATIEYHIFNHHFWGLIEFLVHLNLNLFCVLKINTLEIHQCPERVGNTDELFCMSEPYFWMNTFLPLKI